MNACRIFSESMTSPTLFTISIFNQRLFSRKRIHICFLCMFTVEITNLLISGSNVNMLQIWIAPLVKVGFMQRRLFALLAGEDGGGQHSLRAETESNRFQFQGIMHATSHALDVLNFCAGGTIKRTISWDFYTIIVLIN